MGKGKGKGKGKRGGEERQMEGDVGEQSAVAKMCKACAY
jgi:hypothetical protein